MSEIIKQGSLYDAIENGQITDTSWTAPEDMTFEQWQRAGRTLQQLGRSLNWWLGDWLNQGERRWGEMYTQALEITGQSVESLSKYKNVATRVAPEIRRLDLSWSHHFAVAYGQERHRGPMLEIAAHFELSSRDLKDAMRLSPVQLDQLITLFEQGEYMSLTDFHKGINHIRLTVEEKGVVNGKALPLREYNADSDELDGEDEEPPFAQPELYDEEEADDAVAEEEEEVYIEEVIDFFHTEGARMQVCTRVEAVWDGLFVLAAVDEKGKPYLKWGRPIKG